MGLRALFLLAACFAAVSKDCAERSSLLADHEESGTAPPLGAAKGWSATTDTDVDTEHLPPMLPKGSFEGSNPADGQSIPRLSTRGAYPPEFGKFSAYGPQAAAANPWHKVKGFRAGVPVGDGHLGRVGDMAWDFPEWKKVHLAYSGDTRDELHHWRHPDVLGRNQGPWYAWTGATAWTNPAPPPGLSFEALGQALEDTVNAVGAAGHAALCAGPVRAAIVFALGPDAVSCADASGEADRVLDASCALAYCNAYTELRVKLCGGWCATYPHAVACDANWRAFVAAGHKNENGYYRERRLCGGRHFSPLRSTCYQPRVYQGAEVAQAAENPLEESAMPSTPEDCQSYCQDMEGCEHFTFLLDGSNPGCHLFGAGAQLDGPETKCTPSISGDAVQCFAGPRECGCFYRGAVHIGAPLRPPFPVASPHDCQFHCQHNGHCAFFTYLARDVEELPEGTPLDQLTSRCRLYAADQSKTTPCSFDVSGGGMNTCISGAKYCNGTAPESPRFPREESAGADIFKKKYLPPSDQSHYASEHGATEPYLWKFVVWPEPAAPVPKLVLPPTTPRPTPTPYRATPSPTHAREEYKRTLRNPNLYKEEPCTFPSYCGMRVTSQAAWNSTLDGLDYFLGQIVIGGKYMGKYFSDNAHSQLTAARRDSVQEPLASGRTKTARSADREHRLLNGRFGRFGPNPSVGRGSSAGKAGADRFR